MPAKTVLTEEQMSIFKELASSGATKQQIANTLSIDRSAVTRIIKEFNIYLAPSSKNRQGKKFIWTSELENKLRTLYASKTILFHDICKQFGCSDGVISRKARQLGLKKEAHHPRKEFSEENIQYIINNVGKVSVQEMSKTLNRCDESIEAVIKQFGLKNTYHPKRILLPNNNPQLLLDIGNPAYSDIYLSRLYGYSTGKIKKWRQELYGNRKNMINTYLCKSSAECTLEKILDDLHIAYIYNFVIDMWHVDYNLGFNLLIEVQGDYWHGKIDKHNRHKSINRTIEKDLRKKAELNKLGYEVFEVWESDLSDEDTLKNKLLSLLYGQINKYYNGSLNPVNSK